MGKKISFFGKKNITFGRKKIGKKYVWEKNYHFAAKKITVSQIFTPGRTFPPFSHMSIARGSGSAIRPRSQFKGGAKVGQTAEEGGGDGTDSQRGLEANRRGEGNGYGVLF